MRAETGDAVSGSAPRTVPARSLRTASVRAPHKATAFGPAESLPDGICSLPAPVKVTAKVMLKGLWHARYVPHRQRLPRPGCRLRYSLPASRGRAGSPGAKGNGWRKSKKGLAAAEKGLSDGVGLGDGVGPVAPLAAPAVRAAGRPGGERAAKLLKDASRCCYRCR